MKANPTVLPGGLFWAHLSTDDGSGCVFATHSGPFYLSSSQSGSGFHEVTGAGDVEQISVGRCADLGNIFSGFDALQPDPLIVGLEPTSVDSDNYHYVKLTSKLS